MVRWTATVALLMAQGAEGMNPVANRGRHEWGRRSSAVREKARVLVGAARSVARTLAPSCFGCRIGCVRAEREQRRSRWVRIGTAPGRDLATRTRSRAPARRRRLPNTAV